MNHKSFGRDNKYSQLANWTILKADRTKKQHKAGIAPKRKDRY